MGHKIQMYENLRDVLEREVKEIERKNDITKESLDNLYKLTATLKYVDQCIKKEEEKEGGGSNMDGGYSNARDGRGGYSRNSYDGINMDGMSNMYPTPYALAQQERMMMPNDRIREGMRMEGISAARGRNYAGGSYGESYDSYEGGQSNARERSYEGGGSNDGMSGARRGRDGDGDGRYNESRDNFRDYSGRNTYGDPYGYSRDASRKKMVQKLETLMDDTMSESERQAIQECIERIK